MSRVIVTGGTKKDADAMAVLAMNIQAVNPNIADCFVVFHDGIPIEQQNKMKKIMPMRFIEYHCPIPRFTCLMNKTVRYFSPMVFCKYETFSLLKEYDEVMWTDYDVLIREDISELWESHEYFSTIVNHDVTLKEMFNSKFKRLGDFKYDLNHPSVTTPLFVLKQGIGDIDKITAWCYKTTQRYMRYLYLPEQCIFTMLVDEFDIGYKELDLNTYCLHPRYAKTDTKILHAYGQPKFWNGLDNEDWNKYFREYKEMQG